METITNFTCAGCFTHYSEISEPCPVCEKEKEIESLKKQNQTTQRLLGKEKERTSTLLDALIELKKRWSV